jgi:predicted ATPase/DNA-binding SARP family transcriptional activator/DNA-binding CsgD family transcriptional regulator
MGRRPEQHQHRGTTAGSSSRDTTRKPEVIRIKLLGGFRVWVGPGVIGEDKWHLRKARSLIKLLALSAGHHLHREQIMDLLWPDLGTKAASNNLRRVLHSARKTLDPAVGSSYLASEEGWLALCPAGALWVDVEAFEEAAATARREREPAAYRAALELYAGELLPADRYEEWAEDRRQELRRLDVALLVELAGIYEERGEYGAAIEALRRVTVEEPANEEAHAALMRLYALSGNQAEALRQYERLEQALSKELGVDPNASSRALREEILSGTSLERGRDQGTLIEDSASFDRHNLPAPRTSFVGRQTEMTELKRTLAMTRLLTLTGAGGCGKTRLALEVSRDLVRAYPDGVWLVELAPLSEGALIPKALAEAVGTQEQPGRQITEVLVESMRTKEQLLVMDNCEHLIEAAALLVDALLDGCPNLRVLATSREPLDVAGELNWPVPSLSVPDGQPSTVEEMEKYESTRLFAARASYRRRHFSLTPENVRDVATICRRLDGIPLAIELAAARVGPLSVGQIAQRLDDSLMLLRGGGRTAVPRHRTLRGALDWSHELLSEDEKELFGRLSVFAGGWTLEAAEAVGAGGRVEEDAILDLLSGLVDKSLVVEKPQKSGVRHRMLEPVRQYAREKLEERGESEEIRRRHAGFFLALAEEAEPRLWGPEDTEWLERLDVEHDNLRSALSWALERGDAELGLRLAGALWRFWEAHGHYSEGKRWLEKALEKGGRASAAARAKALEGFGWLVFRAGETNRAVVTAEEGLELSDDAGLGGAVRAKFLGLLGWMVEVQGHHAQAKQLLEESLKLNRDVDDNFGIADTLLMLGSTLSSLGDRKRQRQLHEEGIALSRELGYVRTLGRLLFSVGYVLLLEGDYERGVALNEEAAALYRERGYKGGLEFVLDNLGWAALLQGDPERAKTSYEESLVLCRELGDKIVASESLEGLACVAGVKGEAERAAKLFGVAEALREAVGSQRMPEEDALREPYLATASSQLDEAAWEEAWAEGRAMSMEQAIEYALSEEKSLTPPSPESEQPSSDEPPSLTPREKEVAVLVGRGLTNRQIASELVLSEHTVHHHVTNILKKLNLSSRQQVASRLSDR